ncbi:hypothetical protein HAX54_023786 [Datura stramonium]|uniref:Leucine-rich repeat-containing N-terminal plant-type domain-containing protein n=1 Tax=Datura stramonium TaxID=4076 RepID=A0ABS8UZ54_DATST|nr:hypothetical protein [Datura stramonium]
MASIESKLCDMSIMFLIVFMLFYMQQCKCSELDLLLSMKTSMKDPLGSLHDWIPSQSFCNWKGVVCDDSSHVAKIELSGKNLSGKLSETIFNFPYVESIDVSNNQLYGEIPSNFSSCLALRFLNLSNNNFTGALPQGSTIPLLETLDLSNNMIAGKIPKNIGLFSRLKLLIWWKCLGWKHSNSLRPWEIQQSHNPRQLLPITSLEKYPKAYVIPAIFLNSYSSQIHSRAKSCEPEPLQKAYRGPPAKQLTHGELSPDSSSPLFTSLISQASNLSGPISERKWDMPALQMLNLARNKFLVPCRIAGSKNLENLDLAENGFYGTIPKNIGQLSELMELKLGSNKLSGEIPDELSSCRKIVSLDLSHNQLSGQIPTSLSEMPVLSLLDLSMNELSGEIPPDLGKVESLVLVNISHNHFRGNLPSTGAF